ncbi:serine hydrolase domain-containing protein [Sphingosinicella xenopeptidilytica]|uniref:Serine hydrolase domain-containing protein n=1 Tax=Sphingosinicella xenopeptidilytica TaxID=364098 RepID=A0ABW3C8C1_SPHXN
MKAMTGIALFAAIFSVSARAEPAFPDAAASDPVKLGWMQGSPPPPEKRIAFGDYSFFTFPQWRWSFSHWRELMPSVGVSRGAGPVSALPRAERSDIDGVTFTPIGGTAPMTWAASLAANYTDGIVVLHKGRVVYERYFGALKPEGEHIAFSVTKSFIGTLASMLVVEGKIDPAKAVAFYLPELKDSGFGDATVRQVMDMTTGLDFTEKYGDPNSSFAGYVAAIGAGPRPADYAGPNGDYAYLATVKKAGAHGEGFTYRTVNTDVLGWIVSRVGGKPFTEQLSERIWAPMGAEADGYFQVDPVGTPFAGGGFNMRLLDLARFGELMRLGGRMGGKQILPEAAIADIVRGARKEDFAKAGYATLPGWSYRNQWWVSHNSHGAYTARGIHGQAIYVDPKAEMVIARFASHPMAGNANFDPTSLPAYQALAEHLMRTK